MVTINVKFHCGSNYRTNMISSKLRVIKGLKHRLKCCISMKQVQLKKKTGLNSK